MEYASDNRFRERRHGAVRNRTIGVNLVIFKYEKCSLAPAGRYVYRKSATPNSLAPAG